MGVAAVNKMLQDKKSRFFKRLVIKESTFCI